MNNAQSTNEFALIKQFFSVGFPQHENTVLAVGDDCSIIRPPTGHDLVQSMDAFVADRHFPAHAPAHLIAERCLRCATSDLAAMGAQPYGFHLGLTLKSAQPDWLTGFSQGLKQSAHTMGMSLLGGDTTKGPESVISITVFGWLPAGKALRRNRAQVGDQVWVSDTIGNAALSLAQVLKHPDDLSGLAKHYYYPTIQIPLAQKLLDLATSCMDISDGLLQDASHLAKASNVSLALEAESIPTAVELEDPRWMDCLTGGDDYQLLFTAPAKHQDELLNLTLEHSGIRCIGEVHTQGSELVRLRKEQQPLSLPEHTGFLHF